MSAPPEIAEALVGVSERYGWIVMAYDVPEGWEWMDPGDVNRDWCPGRPDSYLTGSAIYVRPPLGPCSEPSCELLTQHSPGHWPNTP